MPIHTSAIWLALGFIIGFLLFETFPRLIEKEWAPLAEQMIESRKHRPKQNVDYINEGWY